MSPSQAGAVDSQKPEPSGQRPRFFYGWYLVFASWTMVFLINAVAVGIFFKPMLEDFGWDRATLSSVQLVGLLLFTIISPFTGRLVDRFGPRRMILFFIAPQVLSSVINSLATNIWHLYLARFFYGLNVTAATQVLINRWFARKRGVALGILATGYSFGTLLLSPVSQYLILQWTWRPTMMFWAGVTLAVMLPLALLVRDRPEEKGWAPDGVPVEQDNHAEAMPLSSPTVRAGPVLPTGVGLSRALRAPSFWSLLGTHFICGTGCGFIMTHIVIFATDLGYPDMIAASLLSVMGGVNLFGVLVTGHFSDRMSRSQVLAFTHLVRTLSFGLMASIIFTGGGSLWMLYLAVALFGFGWYTTAPLMAGIIADLFGSLRMGTLLGVAQSCHMLGMAIGAYAGGAIFEMTGSYYWFFLVQGLLSLLAVGLSLVIRKRVLAG